MCVCQKNIKLYPAPACILQTGVFTFISIPQIFLRNFQISPSLQKQAWISYPFKYNHSVFQFIHQNPPISSKTLPFSHKKHFCLHQTQLSCFFTIPFSKTYNIVAKPINIAPKSLFVGFL